MRFACGNGRFDLELVLDETDLASIIEAQKHLEWCLRFVKEAEIKCKEIQE